MKPTLNQGRIVIATGWLRPRPGDLVVAKVDGLEVVKRIRKSESRRFELVGDATGHDVYAWVDVRAIRGRLLLI